PTALLARFAGKPGPPFWPGRGRPSHASTHTPPQTTQATPPPTIYPQPADGYLDTAPITVDLSMRALVTLAVAGRVTTYRWAAGPHTVNWKPPAGLAPGTYPAQMTTAS